MLSVKNLEVSVEGKEILRGVDLEISPGEVVALMGPNGSGKSTTAYALMGHPSYIITNNQNDKMQKGKIEIDGEDVTQMGPDERANKGLFLAMQSPVAIPGLTVHNFLRQIYKNRVDSDQLRGTSILEFRKWVERQAELLGLGEDMLKRGLNDGFSGGERKKMEILQMMVFNPKYIILDEIDSGLDVDALRKIAKTVAKIAKEKNIGVLCITHYSRIFEYLEPERVVVMKDGRISIEGDKEILKKIEFSGYQKS